MANELTVGSVYWLRGDSTRTFILGAIGSKKATGLVIEPDGLKTIKVPLSARLEPVLYKGKPYPTRKMRGHLRRMKGLTNPAKKLRKELLV